MHMDKIDFFAGCHGNFLEVILDMFVYKNENLIGKSLFNDSGACHNKHILEEYQPSIQQNHFSQFKIPFDANDRVVEIHVSESDLLAAITNSMIRAGDEEIDVRNLHINTINKLTSVPKAKGLLNDIIRQHGVQDNYSKHTIRNYFYSKLNDTSNGLDLMNTFSHTGSKHIFPLSAFFTLEEFYYNLNQCAYFLNLNFYPTEKCALLWQDFISKNQGYHSQQKCKLLIDAILKQNSMPVVNLTLIEEAWILYKVSKIFRCYDHPLLISETFPTNTQEISDAVYEWKSKDYKAQEV